MGSTDVTDSKWPMTIRPDSILAIRCALLLSSSAASTTVRIFSSRALPAALSFQLDAEASFQRLNVTGECGLRDESAPSRLSEVALLCQDEEHAELLQCGVALRHALEVINCRTTGIGSALSRKAGGVRLVDSPRLAHAPRGGNLAGGPWESHACEKRG